MPGRSHPCPARVVVLVGEAGEYRVAPDVWTRLLHLARVHQWTPAGTLRGASWSGHYAPPCGQMIGARDAAELALALEDLLDDLPDADPPAGARPASILERLGGSAKGRVVRLVEFLRHGAVAVHGGCDTASRPADLV